MLHKDVALLRLPIFTTISNIITTLYKIRAKHFQHFKTILFSKVVFTWKRSYFFLLLVINLVKVIGIDGLATDENFNNFVHSCSDAESQRRCQHLTNALGGMGTLGID